MRRHFVGRHHQSSRPCGGGPHPVPVHPRGKCRVVDVATDVMDLSCHLLGAQGVRWSWANDAAAAHGDSVVGSLPVFCWPPQLWVDRPTAHAFATTGSMGERRFGFVISWVSTLSTTSGHEASVLVILSSLPLEWLFFEVCLCAHERLVRAAACSKGEVGDLADSCVAPLLRALHGTLTEQPALCHALIGEGRERALAALHSTLRPTGLLSTLLAVLLEERILLVGSDPLVVFRAVEALASAIDPLEFCGALVPLLPEGLHPSVVTLLNDAVEPYIVGLHVSHYVCTPRQPPRSGPAPQP